MEAKALAALAVPIAISQVSRVGMGVVDTIFAGHVSPNALAAVGLGSAVWFAVFFFVSGALLVASPLVGARRAGGDQTLMARTVQQICLNSVFWGVVSAFVLVAAAFALPTASMNPEVAQVTRDFILVTAFGAPACALFQGLKFSFDALGAPGRGMRIGLLGFLINIPLNYLFVFGAFGLEGMGAIGCAWATVLVYWLMLFALILSDRRQPLVPGLRLIGAPVGEDQRYLFGKGIPSGVTILLDAGFFSVIAWLAVSFGAVAVAANQIATNFVSLLFVGQIALSMAISIRVSQGLTVEASARAAKVGIGLSILLSLAYTAVLLVFGHQIVAIYTADAEVARIAFGLLSIALLFQFLDAIQVCVAGALRGMHDTLVPMIIVGLAYWFVALPIATALIFQDWLGRSSTIVDVWYGLAIGISVAAVLLGARFLVKTGNLGLASPTLSTR
jgi:MATE family multidrug resistance protein